MLSFKTCKYLMNKCILFHIISYCYSYLHILLSHNNRLHFFFSTAAAREDPLLYVCSFPCQGTGKENLWCPE